MSSIAATTPLLKAAFPVRRMDFSFADTHKYWWSGDPFMSLFMNNLSSLFPHGEKFFVDSVRAVRDQVKDPQLQKDISAFIGQEAMHSKEHQTYNDYALAHGIDLHTLDMRIKVSMGFISKYASKKFCLAVTCCLEHFTAIMAEQLLRREDISMQMADPRMYKLWLWHAIEENEHKSVAYDAYQAIGGGYLMRSATMLLVSILFLNTITWHQLELLIKDRQVFNWKSWKYGLKILFGLRDGYLTGLIGPWLEFFRPGFHPAQQDTRALENRWRMRLGFDR
jgi:predicted metal-dependent hydrolase